MGRAIFATEMTDQSIESIQDSLIAEFAQASDWEDRYRKIIEMGRNLESLPEQFKIDENKVKGCQSSVWLVTEFRDGKIYFSADSDASIVKGLVALLIRVYSGRTPKEILLNQKDFLSSLGLTTNLSQTRVSGLVSMIKQIKFYAMAYAAKSGAQL